MRHKLEDADKKSGPRGYLRDARRGAFAEDMEAVVAAMKAAEVSPRPASSVYTAPAQDATTPPNRPTEHSDATSAQQVTQRQQTPGRRDPLAGLERFTVEPGQPGHPDYYREEREAAAKEARCLYGDFHDDADLRALLDSFLPPGEVSECRCARVMLSEIADRHSKRTIGTACKSPSCKKCRPAVCRQTFRRFMAHVGRLPNAPVYISHVLATDWRSDRLWEKAGKYGRVVEQFYGSGKEADARYLVLSAKALPDSTPMGRKEALVVVAAAIRRYPGEARDFITHHPFVFCRSWGAVEEEVAAEDHKERPKKWEIDTEGTARLLKSGLGLTTAGLVSILRHYGVEAHENKFFYKDRERLYVDFRMPDDGEVRARINLAIELGSAEDADAVFSVRQADEEAQRQAVVEAAQRDFELAVFGHP